MAIEHGSLEDGIQSDVERYLLATYDLFVLLTSLFGDTTILIATTKYNAIKLNKTHIVIMQHLAVADLLMSVFNVFPIIVAAIANRWILGELLCRLHGLVKFWLYSVVLALTCSLTTSKLLTVKFPFYSRIWSAKSTHGVCLFIWVASLAILTDFADSFSNDLYFSYVEYSCFIIVESVPAWCVQLLKVVWSVLIVLIITVILTSLLLVIEAKRAASRNNRAVRWEGILTVILTGAVVVVSFGLILVFWFTPKIHYSVAITRSAGILFNLNVMANFFIYAMTVQSFREFLKEKLREIFGRFYRHVVNGTSQDEN